MSEPLYGEVIRSLTLQFTAKAMPSLPRLAIVIPSRDSRELTLKCLHSLFSGGVSGLEVWVVDDASRDDTCAAIEDRFPSVGVLRSGEPGGFTVSANRGLRQTRADLLLLLNSDTEVEPGSLTALIEAFAQDPRLGVAGGTLHYPDGSPQWSGGREPSLQWLFALASGLPRLLARLPGYRRLRPLEPPATPAPVDWVTGAALALRREVWEEVGPLDERFRFYCQDLDLCRRASQAGWGIALLPGFRVLHHHGATIGRDTGTQAGRQNPELLWTDLALWAAQHRGGRWASTALAALRLGGRLRLLGRLLARPFVPPTERRSWDRDHQAYRRALAALRRFSPENLPPADGQDKTTAVGNSPNPSP